MRGKSNWDSYWGEESRREYWQKPDGSVMKLIDHYDPERQPEVLDLGCGIGRHAAAFARAGYMVTALDSSPEALKRLAQYIEKYGLDIKIVAGDYLEKIFPEESFDIIVSYNVIYHGCREDFKRAVQLCCSYLKPGGLLFFTCPSRDDGKYGSGEEVALHTYKSLNSVHPGDIHYFADQDDITEFTEGLMLTKVDKKEHYWDNDGTRQFSSYWEVLAGK